MASNKAGVIRIGAIAFDQKLDPTDPDDIGGIAGPGGVVNDALEIQQANAARFEELTPLLALPRDLERTATLDVDELQEVVEDTSDIKATVLGGSVRGSSSDPGQRVVTYLVEYPSGRTSKGAVAYAKLPRSAKAYDQARKLKLDSSRAARTVGGDAAVGTEDPRVETLTEEIDRLREELAAAAKPPEPEVEDFGTIDAIRELVAAETDPLEREILKRRIRTAEEALTKPRQGVIDLTEPVALVEPQSAE